MGESECEHTICGMFDPIYIDPVQWFHLYRIVNTSSHCTFSFPAVKKKFHSELQSDVLDRIKPPYGNECICHQLRTYPLIHAVVSVQWAAGKINRYLCLRRYSHCRLDGHTYSHCKTQKHVEKHEVRSAVMQGPHLDENRGMRAALHTLHTHTHVHTHTHTHTNH